MDILAWWNLIFLLPCALALLYVLLLAFGIAAVDHDHGPDVHGLDHGDADLHGHDLHGAHGVGVAGAVLSALGVGRVPLPVVFTSLAFTWGFTGWASNLVLSRTPVVEAFFPALSIPIAAVVAFAVTGATARLLARILPATESYGARNYDLVGRLAEARFTITESFGRAFLYDAHGTPQEVTCRVQPGEPPIVSGSRVLLFDYDRERDMFLVCPDPTQNTGESAGQPLRREP